MGFAIVWLINAVISLMIWFIIAQAILSWLVAFDVINYRNRFVHSVGSFLDQVTRPLLEPFRRIIPSRSAPKVAADCLGKRMVPEILSRCAT